MSFIKYLILLLFGLWSFGCTNTSLYYLEEGKLIDRSQAMGLRDRAIERLLSGHYIESGDKLILLIRKFDKGDSHAVDDEPYEKITLEIGNYDDGGTIQIGSPDVKFYYSSGASAFISRGSGVFSSEALGTIAIEKKNANHLRVKLDIVILAKPAREGTALIKERTVTLKEEYVLKKISLGGLTPWLGMRHPSYYREVYP
jgi:hypothetical protein